MHHALPARPSPAPRRRETRKTNVDCVCRGLCGQMGMAALCNSLFGGEGRCGAARRRTEYVRNGKRERATRGVALCGGGAVCEARRVACYISLFAAFGLQ